MFLEEVEDRACDVALAVAARAGHERVLALDDDAVARAALVGVERRRLTVILARFQPLREGAARRRARPCLRLLSRPLARYVRSFAL